MSPQQHMKNFKDFFETNIDSNNFQKIHGLSACQNTLLWIFPEFLELMCTWKKINPEKYVFEFRKRKLAPKNVKKFMGINGKKYTSVTKSKFS